MRDAVCSLNCYRLTVSSSSESSLLTVVEDDESALNPNKAGLMQAGCSGTCGKPQTTCGQVSLWLIESPARNSNIISLKKIIHQLINI